MTIVSSCKHHPTLPPLKDTGDQRHKTRTPANNFPGLYKVYCFLLITTIVYTGRIPRVSQFPRTTSHRLAPMNHEIDLLYCASLVSAWVGGPIPIRPSRVHAWCGLATRTSTPRRQTRISIPQRRVNRNLPLCKRLSRQHDRTPAHQPPHGQHSRRRNFVRDRRSAQAHTSLQKDGTTSKRSRSTRGRPNPRVVRPPGTHSPHERSKHPSPPHRAQQQCPLRLPHCRDPLP